MIPKNDTGWVKTNFANLYKSPAGTYWMKAKIKGRLVRKSLKTRSFEIAQIKLKDCHAEHLKNNALAAPQTFKAISDEWLEIDSQSREIKQSTKHVHEGTVAFILRTWPELGDMNLAKIKDCDPWAHRVRSKFAPQTFNAALMVMRSIFKLAIKRHVMIADPSLEIKYAQCRPREAHLPSMLQFVRMLNWLDRRPKTQPTAVLVRVLAFTGMRVGEAKKLMPSMVKFEAGEICLPRDITKSGEERTFPIIAELKPVLRKLLTDHESGRLMPVYDIRSGLTAACKAVDTHRITHHDLRKLFVTRCIESGVDIKTIATWIGHSDGGALILKTYAHLRNEHSQAMAAKVSFAQPLPAGVIKLEQAGSENAIKSA